MSGDSLPQWMQGLVTGWPLIRANLPTFFVILVGIIAALWAAFSWSYSSILAAKNSQIELQDRQLADYREKLKGATPEQAKEKIDSLERTVRMTIGEKWAPLTKSEILALAAKLTEMPKVRAQIMYENALGRELAQSIFDAFARAGWDKAELTTGSGLGESVVTGWGSRGVALKAALNATTRLPVWVREPEKDIADLVIVGVGINTR